MATASARVSRWARGFVVASACWLVVWHAATLLGGPRRVAVSLALYGFVFHMLFGKAYSLVPSYFDRDLTIPRAPAVHLPLALAGTVGLAAAPLEPVPSLAGTVGAVAWSAGVVVFLGTLGLTIRDNLTGAETGTGDHNASRQPVDRAANAVIPVALAYLAVGTYATLAGPTPLPPLLDGYAPRTSHLLAAGTAALFVVAIGARLLPRFLVATPPRALVLTVLSAGAVGPALLVVGLPAGPLLRAGAVIEGIAVVGFGATFGWLFHESDRARVGFYGVLAGALAGLLGVGLAAHVAFTGASDELVVAHYRLMLGGFLGLTIVGVAYQFYPPSIGRFPLAHDRSAFATIAAIGGGLLLSAGGLVTGRPTVVVAGEVATLAGAVGFAYLLGGVFLQRALD